MNLFEFVLQWNNSFWVSIWCSNFVTIPKLSYSCVLNGLIQMLFSCYFLILQNVTDRFADIKYFHFYKNKNENPYWIKVEFMFVLVIKLVIIIIEIFVCLLPANLEKCRRFSFFCNCYFKWNLLHLDEKIKKKTILYMWWWKR